jgi:hypothetical protein
MSQLPQRLCASVTARFFIRMAPVFLGCLESWSKDLTCPQSLRSPSSRTRRIAISVVGYNFMTVVRLAGVLVSW